MLAKWSHELCDNFFIYIKIAVKPRHVIKFRKLDLLNLFLISKMGSKNAPTHWSRPIIIVIIFGSAAVAVIAESRPSANNEYSSDSCYAEAVRDELMRAIEILNVRSDINAPPPPHSSHKTLKKIQDDEDEAIEGPTDFIDFAPIIPMIVKIVGSALSLNSTGVAENSLGFIPERVSNQITNVLGTLANSILGTPTTTTRPRRRRTGRTTRRSTTTPSSEVSNSTSVSSEIEPEVKITTTTLNSTSVEARKNETGEEEQPEPTTRETLFKESNLGELPVYAPNYAPNYVATTPFPVYASNFLHSLYPAPPTTSTTTAPTTTSADPNSFSVPLPFDYVAGSSTTSVAEANSTSVIEEDDDDYEEGTEESSKLDKVRQNQEVSTGSLGWTDTLGQKYKKKVPKLN